MEERENDPAFQPVDEAGGGESEGFEQAERDLIEHAEHTSGEGIPRLEEEMSPEAEAEPTSHGEADQERPPDA